MEEYNICIKSLSSSEIIPISIIESEYDTMRGFVLSATIDGVTYRGESDVFFSAFQSLRDQFLSIGYGMNCCGALLNAVQSPMMSVADKIYLVTLGQKALKKDVVSIFDHAAPQAYPDTAAQCAFEQEWFHSLDARFRR